MQHLEPALRVILSELQLAELAQQGEFEIIAAPGEAERIERLDRVGTAGALGLIERHRRRVERACASLPVVCGSGLRPESKRPIQLAQLLRDASMEIGCHGL